MTGFSEWLLQWLAPGKIGLVGVAEPRAGEGDLAFRSLPGDSDPLRGGGDPCPAVGAAALEPRGVNAPDAPRSPVQKASTSTFGGSGGRGPDCGDSAPRPRCGVVEPKLPRVGVEAPPCGPRPRVGVEAPPGGPNPRCGVEAPTGGPLLEGDTTRQAEFDRRFDSGIGLWSPDQGSVAGAAFFADGECARRDSG